MDFGVGSSKYIYALKFITKKRIAMHTFSSKLAIYNPKKRKNEYVL
jgi:hypothetical protein